jgi:hypothetical protein
MIHGQNSVAAAEQAAQAFGAFVHEHAVLQLAPYVPAFIGMMLLARWLPEDTRGKNISKGEMALGGVRPAAIVALALVVGTGVFLATQHSRQKLGQPGVRIVQEPLYTIEGGASTNPPVLAKTNRVYLPAQVLDYRSQQGFVSQMTVKTLPEDTVFGHRIYAQPNDFAISCQVVLMGADRSSIHKPQYCLRGLGYTTIDTQPVTVRVSRPHAYDLPVMKLKLRRTTNKDGETRTEGAVFAYWFVADGELTSSHADRMWWMARDMLRTGVLQRWAYVICLAPCVPGQEDRAFEKIKEFIAASVPEFQLTAGPPAAKMAAK